MRQVDLCQKLKKATLKILLLENGDITSQGSGVFVHPGGFALTANHVVRDFFTLSSPTIIGIRAEGPPVTFANMFGNITIDVGTPEFVKPLEIDLAILIPQKGIKTDEWLQLQDAIPSEGVEVIGAGFPEDIKPPLNFQNKIRFTGKDVADKEAGLRQFVETRLRLVMFRRAMIGSVFPIHLKGKANISDSEVPFATTGAEFWLDNTAVRGSSGGPVVNMQGKLLGLICERGETSISDLSQQLAFEVPSGSTMVQSHKLITWSLEKFTGGTIEISGIAI